MVERVRSGFQRRWCIDFEDDWTVSVRRNNLGPNRGSRNTYANMHVYGMEGPRMSGCRKEVIGHKTGAVL